jgi:hypothetical protein
MERWKEYNEEKVKKKERRKKVYGMMEGIQRRKS